MGRERCAIIGQSHSGQGDIQEGSWKSSMVRFSVSSRHIPGNRQSASGPIPRCRGAESRTPVRSVGVLASILTQRALHGKCKCAHACVVSVASLGRERRCLRDHAARPPVCTACRRRVTAAATRLAPDVVALPNPRREHISRAPRAVRRSAIAGAGAFAAARGHMGDRR